MYRIFSLLSTSNLGTFNSPSVDRVRELFKDRLAYQNTRYHSYGSHVPSNHILERLIYVLSHYLPVGDSIYRAVRENLHDICSALGITSADTVGRVHHNAFYTSTCLLVAADFDIPDPVTDWRQFRPVRCLTHPGLTMDVLIPKVRNFQVEGLSAVGIDIPLFAYMLRKWSLVNEARSPEEQESLAQFISRYILVGMIPEQIDISLRNRIPYFAKQELLPKAKESPLLASYAEAMQPPIERVLQSLQRTRQPYRRALSNIPFVFTENYLKAVPTGIGILSTYSYWTTYCIMVDWVYPLLAFLGENQKDNTDIAHILKRVNRYTVGTDCLRYIPEELQAEVNRKYQAIVDRYHF